MTTSNVVLIESKQAEGTQTTQYTAISVKTIIDKFTVSNTTVGNVTFACNLVNSGDTAGADSLTLPARTILPGEVYNCPELVGHYLASGDFISTIAGAAASLTIRASGREISG